VLDFKMPLESIYNKNLGFTEKKCIFEHHREVQTIKSQPMDTIFVMKKYFW
jgi:hypothetical protein